MKYVIDRYRSSNPRSRQRFHSHEEGEILFFTEGKGVFHTAERDYTFKAGTAIIVPAGLAHISRAEEDFVSITVADEGKKQIMAETPVVLRDNEEGDGRALAEMLFRYRHVKSPFVADLINAYIRFWLQRAELPGATETVLNEVYQTLLANATDQSLDLAAVLTAGGYAEDYIRMLFKKRYGMPPVKFIAKLRMEQACFLMDTYKEIPLAEVAERCGYDDYVYFSKTFKTHIGMSPREYMKGKE